jgi:hypothetical protein
MSGHAYSPPVSRGALLLTTFAIALTFTSVAAPARITGTSRADLIRGTAKADTLYGRAGDDRIYGLAGNDRIVPGAGKDRVFCGRGVDRVVADLKDVVARDCEVVSRPKPPAEIIAVSDAFTSTKQDCSDRVTDYPLSTPRVYLCVYIGAITRNHTAQIEWVTPSGTAHPFTFTITPGYAYWSFWIEFGSNTELGTWTSKYSFDGALRGQVTFQRI